MKYTQTDKIFIDYSEDMHNNLIVEDKVKIINPLQKK